MCKLSAHITKHRAGWRYKRLVPKDVQDEIGAVGTVLISGKGGYTSSLEGYTDTSKFWETPPPRPDKQGRVWWRRYFGDDGKEAAHALGRKWGTFHDEQIGRIRALDRVQRAELIAAGGLVALTETAIVDAIASLAPSATLEELQVLDPSRSLEAIELEQLRGLKEHAQQRANAAHVRKLLPVGDYGWDALLAHWKGKPNGKGRLPRFHDTHEQVAEELRLFKADADYRTFSAHDAEAFLAFLASRGYTKRIIKLREAASGLFASLPPTMRELVNPFDKIIANVAHVAADREAYTGVEIAHITATMRAKGFGGTRHKPALWLWLFSVFMGNRIREASQLQRGDVAKLSGVWCVHIRDTDVVTGKLHPEKDVKGDQARLLPLHPALYDAAHPLNKTVCNGESFVDFAKGDPAGFVFGAFDFYQKNGKPKPQGRAQWMIQEMGPFVRDVCNIERANLGPNHSLRHRWEAAARDAKFTDQEVSRFMWGVKGKVRYVSAVYKELLRKLRDVDPLSD